MSTYFASHPYSKETSWKSFPTLLKTQKASRILRTSQSDRAFFNPASTLTRCPRDEYLLLYQEHLRSRYNWYAIYEFLWDAIQDSDRRAGWKCSCECQKRWFNSGSGREDRPQWQTNCPTLEMEDAGVLLLLFRVHNGGSIYVLDRVWCIKTSVYQSSVW